MKALSRCKRPIEPYAGLNETVTSAKAGVQKTWIPAFAGMADTDLSQVISPFFYAESSIVP